MRQAWRTVATAGVLAVVAALSVACGTAAGPPPATAASPPPVTTTPSAAVTPAAPTAAPTAEPTADRTALWEEWKRLNVVCRGSSGPESDTACARRSVVQERQARTVAAEFFDAWTRGDTATMAELTHPDSPSTGPRSIPAGLVKFRPTEPAFDCRYDIEATSPFGCYTAVTGSGADLYVRFDVDDGRGWLALSFAPDV